jgi:hypothetical protein
MDLTQSVLSKNSHKIISKRNEVYSKLNQSMDYSLPDGLPDIIKKRNGMNMSEFL